MTWQIWSAFVVIETALCLTPGPADSAGERTVRISRL
jgi:hypothetical protein